MLWWLWSQHLVGTSVTWLVTVLQNLKYNKSLLSFSLTLCLFAPCLAAELLASSPGCLCPWPCWAAPHHVTCWGHHRRWRRRRAAGPQLFPPCSFPVGPWFTLWCQMGAAAAHQSPGLALCAAFKKGEAGHGELGLLRNGTVHHVPWETQPWDLAPPVPAPGPALGAPNEGTDNSCPPISCFCPLLLKGRKTWGRIAAVLSIRQLFQPAACPMGRTPVLRCLSHPATGLGRGWGWWRGVQRGRLGF